MFEVIILKMRKPNMSIIAGSFFIGLGLSAAAALAAAPKIKNFASKMSNTMQNDNFNNSMQ